MHMYGAIFGDIIGSRFEFDRGGKAKEFTLFTREDSFTDDTVMTIAVGDALLKAGKDADAPQIREAVIRAMRDWGRRYPYAGYGGRFIDWLFNTKKPQPYNSFGNGSAMRVSAAGWLFDTLERTREAARATAEVTHNHPEGIKGAECTAAVIFLARTGHGKEEIRDYVIREFGYDLTESLEQLRARHAHIESCQDSLPKALTAFFLGMSFEDVIRNAVSLGGDTDTLAAIAGAMGEAMYGIPLRIHAEGFGFLPEDMRGVLEEFDRALGRIPESDPDRYGGNAPIRKAVARIWEAFTKENFLTLLNVLTARMLQEGEAPTPMVDVNHAIDALDPDTLRVGDALPLDRDLRLIFDTMQDGSGSQWLPLFTDEEELRRCPTTNVTLNVPIRTILESGLTSNRVKGVVINPFGQAMTLTKDVLQLLVDACAEAPEMQA